MEPSPEISKEKTRTNAGTAQLKHFGKPDEVKTFPNGRMELLHIGGASVRRTILEPGWRWSISLQPLVKTSSCEIPHFQYHVSGVLMVKMDDDQILECRPGDVSNIPAGHDAWVVGDEPVVLVDFQDLRAHRKAH